MNSLKEQDCILAIEQSVVIGECQVHHGTRDYLVASDHGTIDDGVHAEDGALGWVDDGGAHEGSEGAAVGDGESSALHVLDGDLSLLALLSEVGQALSGSGVTSSKSWNFMFWQFLRTGTSRPVGVATATEISTKFLRTISFPSITEFTTGYSWRASVAAFRKKDMKPSLTLYFLRKSSPSS